MDVRNCKKCGKIFSYFGNQTCPKCLSKAEDDYKIVKEYIWNNQKATVAEVSEATGVSSERILRYLREGRLEISEDCVNLFLDCEMCGIPIKSGRYCPKCAIEMEKILKKEASELSNRSNPMEAKTGGKMHVADMMNKRK